MEPFWINLALAGLVWGLAKARDRVRPNGKEIAQLEGKVETLLAQLEEIVEELSDGKSRFAHQEGKCGGESLQEVREQAGPVPNL